jgi:hypothetical protein
MRLFLKQLSITNALTLALRTILILSSYTAHFVRLYGMSKFPSKYE